MSAELASHVIFGVATFNKYTEACTCINKLIWKK
jgi:hypothetical protein